VLSFSKLFSVENVNSILSVHQKKMASVTDSYE